jgi:hypothetical protein
MIQLHNEFEIINTPTDNTKVGFFKKFIGENKVPQEIISAYNF